MSKVDFHLSAGHADTSSHSVDGHDKSNCVDRRRLKVAYRVFRQVWNRLFGIPQSIGS